MNNLPHLPFTEYRFTYQADEAIKIPPFPSQLLHGALGNALIHNVCIVPTRQCQTCLMKSQCAYPRLFKRQYITSSDQRLQHTASPPYVFRYHQQGFMHVPSRHHFSLRLVVIGHACHRLDELIYAMRTLGKLGISRKKATLVSIEQMMPHGGLPMVIKHRMDHIAPTQPVVPEPPQQVTIDLITPYILSEKMMRKPFDIRYWLMGIIRRVSSLQNTYTDQMSTADFVFLKQLTEQAYIDDPQLYVYETPQTRKSHTSGILGQFILSLHGIEALWPWIYWGQWLHNGKKTSNGNGRYRLLH